MLPFDIAFADTCIGGSTVASRLARNRTGLRAFYLADYGVNPLGTKSREEVREALTRWVEMAASRAPLLVVACNTASVRLREAPEVLHRARELGLEIRSMADFLQELLERAGEEVGGRRVCLMGTEFTVARPLYREALSRAGAGEVLPLPATLTERTIAHLRHRTPRGRATIREEVRTAVSRADAVLLACTCFPLAEEVLLEVNPKVTLLDPAVGVEGLEGLPRRPGPNRLTVGLSGSALAPTELERAFSTLFPGWEQEGVVEVRTHPGPA